MASSLVSNTNQVHFASVLAMDNSKMVAMLEALVASDLNVYLGCMSDIFEYSMIEFYHNASVQDDKVFSTVQGKLVETPVEGLIDINEIAVENVEGLKSLVKKTPVKWAVSKKRPAVAIEEQVVKKKRTLKGKAAPSKEKLELVSVALDAAPIQTVDLTSVDDVDGIIETVLSESAQLDTDVGSPVVQKTDEIEHWFDLSYEEFTARQDNKIVESASETDEEHDTFAYEPSVGEQQLQTFVEPEVAKEIEMKTILANPVIKKSDDILVEADDSSTATTAKDIDLATVTDVGQFSSDEELLSIDDLLKRIPGDMMLP
ncbi:hypothetical protein F511_39127 [Dorcoceras hygrometricum]|uniref:Uncharacterized protein n=1 Tax=Dorcoceras hygrometricum TaxID=472368 RepID=A0A2Z7ARR4_9LAMI|nr:hypothetical protein F511_39127 [Dorcoceras hygrometricum]